MSITDFLTTLFHLIVCGAAAFAVSYAVNKVLSTVMPEIASMASILAFVAVFIAALSFLYPAAATFLGYVAVVIAASGAVAWVFRAVLRAAMPEMIAKPMRQAPLTAAFGILIILIYIVCAVFADVLAPYGQAEIFDKINLSPGGDPEFGGDPRFWLGTDQIGRDILTRLIYGAQNTVGIAFVTTMLAFLLGATLGFLAATVGGWLDQLVSRTVDVMMSIPSLIFALLIITVVGQSTWKMVLVIAVLDSTRVYRLARAVGLNIVVMDYIEAAKLRGEGLGHLIFKEILPNASAPLLAEFGLRFCFVFPDHRRALVPRARHPAAAGRLGLDGVRVAPVHQFRAVGPAQRRAAPDGGGRDRALDRRG